MPTLTATLTDGIGWVTRHWPAVIAAHPELAAAIPGTCNLRLSEPVTLPHDAACRIAARARGRRCGCPVRTAGNYVHPTVRVQSVAGVPLDGRVYVAGMPESRWLAWGWHEDRSTSTLEVVAERRVRDVAPDGEPFTVVVTGL